MNELRAVLVIVVVGSSLIVSVPWLLEKLGDLVERIDMIFERKNSPVEYAQRQAEMRDSHHRTSLKH
jgi:hypothetical protein